MMLKEMNAALQRLREKYAVSANGTLTAAASGSYGAAAELEFGTDRVKLLPWRVERRFCELKKLIDGKTLEDVSTLRFAWMRSGGSLESLLYRELDLCAWLGESQIRSVFAVVNGRTANLVVKLRDGKSCSVECSAMLPAGTEEMDKHEIIARRGVACDRVVDTQIPQASLYQFTAAGEKRYTDIDTELFGFSTGEIWLVRAAFAVLSAPTLASEWNRIDAVLNRQVADALATEKNGRPVTYPEK